MSSKVAINESFVLPSKGMVYSEPIDPNVTLRSMTTLEEMKRLSPSDTPYKVMSDIIEDCLVEKPKIKVYEMCLGDYQYLLYKLRTVTYGNEYKMMITCPHCGKISYSSVNIDSLEVNEYDETYLDSTLIELPITNKKIELKYQTPRDLDNIAYKKKEMQKKTKTNIDYGLLYTVMSLISKVDGRVLDSIAKEEFVKNLPMRDVNYLLSKASEMNAKVGVDNKVQINCEYCGNIVVNNFRITHEFFGPDGQ